MGRAARRVNDHFTGVLGERRGLRQDQEALSSAPPSLEDTKVVAVSFASDPEVAYRRMSVVEFLIEKAGSSNITSDPREVIQKTGAYADFLDTVGGDAEARCYEDLEELQEAGVCYRSDTYRGVGVLVYGIMPMHLWPEGYDQAFTDYLEKKYQTEENLPLQANLAKYLRNNT